MNSTPNTIHEQMLLAHALLDPIAASTICAAIKPEDLTEPFLRRVLVAISSAVDQHQSTDPASISLRIGGPDAVAGVFALVDLVPGAYHTSHWVSVCQDAARLRRIASLASEVCGKAKDASPTGNASEAILDDLGAGISEMSVRTARDIQVGEADPDLVRKIVAGERIHRGLTTGFPDLDLQVGGLRKGELIVLAARPSVGKSLLAGQIAEHLAVRDEDAADVLFISLEMSPYQIMRRILFSRAGVRPTDAMSGNLGSDEIRRLELADKEIKRARTFRLHPPERMSTQRLRAISQRWRSKAKGDALLVVDYLGLLHAPGKTRYEQITLISCELKTLAIELDIPLLALSQLNRASIESGGGPELHHLRDSGSIEQDADVVLLLHRKSLDEEKGESRTATLDVAKNRPGRCGGFELLFDVDRVRFLSKSRCERFYP